MDMECDCVLYDQEDVCGHLEFLSLLHILLFCLHPAGLQYFPLQEISIIRDERSL